MWLGRRVTKVRVAQGRGDKGGTRFFFRYWCTFKWLARVTLKFFFVYFIFNVVSVFFVVYRLLRYRGGEREGVSSGWGRGKGVARSGFGFTV